MKGKRPTMKIAENPKPRYPRANEAAKTTATVMAKTLGERFKAISLNIRPPPR